MGKGKRSRHRNVTKTTPEPATAQLVVNELRITSADLTRKDIGSFSTARESAKSVWNPNRVALYDLYEDMELDGHLSGITSKRVDAVVNKVLYYESKSGKKVDAFDDLLENEHFLDMIREVVRTKFWGITGLEFVPGEEFNWIEVPRKHIKPELGIIAKEQYGNEGYVYKDISNIIIIGKKNDLGLYLKCSPYAIYKRGNIADWSQYIEIFGQPVRVIKYDAYDTKTKIELKQVMDESGSSLAIMIPKQADFEMKDGKQSNGDGQLQERFKTAMNSEMSIVILGNTETTTSSSSSGYAQSKEHSKQQLEITKSDLVSVRSFLNSKKFAAVLKSFGFPVEEGGRWKFEKEVDIDALLKEMELDEMLSAQVPLDDDYWYNKYGRPKPANYAELKAQKEEERKASLKIKANDPDEEHEEKQPGKKPAAKPGKKEPKNLKATKSAWMNLRAALADFFDPAP